MLPNNPLEHQFSHYISLDNILLCWYQFSWSLSCVWLFETPWTEPARFLCPSPTPGACSNSCPLHQWCHPTTSFSVVPFSCLLSFPAFGSFPRSQFFSSGGQSTGVSASPSVFPMNIQYLFPLGWTGWNSLQSQEFPPTPQFKSINPSALSFV